MKKNKILSPETKIKELYFHLSNSGVTFSVVECATYEFSSGNKDVGGGEPKFIISQSSFGDMVVTSSYILSTEGLRELGEMLIEASKHPFHGKNGYELKSPTEQKKADEEQIKQIELLNAQGADISYQIRGVTNMGKLMGSKDNEED